MAEDVNELKTCARLSLNGSSSSHSYTRLKQEEEHFNMDYWPPDISALWLLLNTLQEFSVTSDLLTFSLPPYCSSAGHLRPVNRSTCLQDLGLLTHDGNGPGLVFYLIG